MSNGAPRKLLVYVDAIMDQRRALTVGGGVHTCPTSQQSPAFMEGQRSLSLGHSGPVGHEDLKPDFQSPGLSYRWLHNHPS